MKKIIIGILIVLILAIITTVMMSGAREQPQSAVEQFTDFGSNVVPTTNLDTRPVSPTNSSTRVTDITKLPEVVDIGDGMYSLNGTRSNPSANFSLLFSEADNSYSIAILAEPVAGNRMEASKYFLELLQIDETTACGLKVYLGTVASVNQTLSGKNLGLSFCPGAVQL
jgi:hypothetical protein